MIKISSLQSLDLRLFHEDGKTSKKQFSQIKWWDVMLMNPMGSQSVKKSPQKQIQVNEDTHRKIIIETLGFATLRWRMEKRKIFQKTKISQMVGLDGDECHGIPIHKNSP